MQLTLLEQVATIAARLGHGWAQAACAVVPEISAQDAAIYAAVSYITADEQDRPEVNTRFTVPGGITLADSFSVDSQGGWVWEHKTGTGRLRLFASASHDNTQHCRVEVHRPDRVIGGLGGSICVIRAEARNFQELDWEVSSLAEPRHYEAVFDALALVPPNSSKWPDPAVEKEMLAAFGVIDDTPAEPTTEPAPAVEAAPEANTSESQEE